MMKNKETEAREKIIERLNRIEGQIRGIKKMIQEDRGCFDILKQVSAAHGALRSLQKVMLEHHIHDCLEEALENRDRKSGLLKDLARQLSDL